MSLNAAVIIAYHPPLFKSFKRLTLADPKQNIALKCAAHGISILSPHTALDSCAGGINDWLASGLGATKSVVAITPGVNPGDGVGRIATLSEAVPLDTMISRIKAHLKLNHGIFRMAYFGIIA